jgi:hypothetical protein
MCAMLTAPVRVFTRPTTSSMSFGLLPAAVMRVGCSIRVGITFFPGDCRKAPARQTTP